MSEKTSTKTKKSVKTTEEIFINFLETFQKADKEERDMILQNLLQGKNPEEIKNITKALKTLRKALKEKRCEIQDNEKL
ncbi:hypothetical protein BKN14_01830 [Candidatus Gracilibacteria bacterium HOT-871]|jgi:hypothetical protein|nr:hypothetical protein BKN14_01830 [Candidatus Gracilibacteria bacterium HOT-871]